MTLTELQRSLDLYGAAVWWQKKLGSRTLPFVVRCVNIARNVGASDSQLADARIYAQKCVLNNRRPLMAGPSYEVFKNTCAFWWNKSTENTLNRRRGGETT